MSGNLPMREALRGYQAEQEVGLKMIIGRSASGNVVPRAVAIVTITMMLANVRAIAETITSEGPQPTDPLIELEAMYQPRDQFSLYSQSDVDLIHFKHDHLISICVPRENHNQIGSAAHAVGLIVKFDGDTQTVTPGSCFSLEAKQVSVKPDGPVGQNNVLTGTVRIVR